MGGLWVVLCGIEKEKRTDGECAAAKRCGADSWAARNTILVLLVGSGSTVLLCNIIYVLHIRSGGAGMFCVCIC